MLRFRSFPGSILKYENKNDDLSWIRSNERWMYTDVKQQGKTNMKPHICTNVYIQTVSVGKRHERQASSAQTVPFAPLSSPNLLIHHRDICVDLIWVAVSHYRSKQHAIQDKRQLYSAHNGLLSLLPQPWQSRLCPIRRPFEPPLISRHLPNDMVTLIKGAINTKNELHHGKSICCRTDVISPTRQVLDGQFRER